MKKMAEKIALYDAMTPASLDNIFVNSGKHKTGCQDECDSTKYSYQVPADYLQYLPTALPSGLHCKVRGQRRLFLRDSAEEGEQ